MERCVGSLKEGWLVRMWFEKLAGGFMAFVRLAFVHRYPLSADSRSVG